MARSSLLPAPAPVEYPSSHGQPIVETDHQRTPLTYAVDALRFRDPRTGRDLSNLAEEAEARQRAESRLARETAARRPETAAS